MSYQFIVITACQKRKENMMELFKQIDISDNLIYYLQASTPENSEDYFIDTSFTNTQKINICCSRSHYRAIEYAAQDMSPDYSIILEDDAAIHKKYFLKVIEEIISNWEQHFNHCHYVSLGWVPCNNYDYYKLKNNMKVKSITNIDSNIVFLNGFLNVGLQCYIVKKNNLNEISLVLNKSSFNIFKESISSFMNTKYNSEFKQYCKETADHILNRMMKYEIIFPPLVIEQKNIKSLLGHENVKKYWNTFFTGHEEEMKNYMTY